MWCCVSCCVVWEQVDQAILSEEERVVVVRFGHDWDPTCMQMDEILYKMADKVRQVVSIIIIIQFTHCNCNVAVTSRKRTLVPKISNITSTL